MLIRIENKYIQICILERDKEPSYRRDEKKLYILLKFLCLNEQEGYVYFTIYIHIYGVIVIGALV